MELATTIVTMEQLGSAAIAVPQCIDNQFVTRDVFHQLTAEHRTLSQIIQANVAGTSKGVASTYARDQKVEYIRALLYSEKVVLNRAAFWNSPTLITAALGGDREGLVELIASTAIVPFLSKESAFEERPKFPYLEQGEQAVLSLAGDPALANLTCVRLSADNNEKRVAAMADDFRSEMSRLHRAEDRVRRAQEIAQRLLLGKAESRRQFLGFRRKSAVDALATRVLNVAKWASSGMPFNRNEVYERFITKGTTADGDFRGAPFTFELKMWIDLVYNSNLPRYLEARSFTPQGFPTPLDLDITWAWVAQRAAEVHPESGDPVIDEVIDRLRVRQRHEAWNAIVQAATVAVPAPHEIDHNDLVVIRGWDEWREMTAAMERHLDTPLNPAGLAELNVAYREFLLKLGSWWVAAGRPRRAEMAAGVAKVYRVGEWTVGLLQIANELLPIIPSVKLVPPPGLDGVIKAVVQTTLYVFDKTNVNLHRSQAIRGLEKVQKISVEKLYELERQVRAHSAELRERPYVGSASNASVATEEGS